MEEGRFWRLPAHVTELSKQSANYPFNFQAGWRPLPYNFVPNKLLLKSFRTLPNFLYDIEEGSHSCIRQPPPPYNPIVRTAYSWNGN
jgi:hypothetical protein